MKPAPVIGIAGLARTGKDVLASFIQAQYGGYRYAFAAPIRRMLKAGFSIDLDTPWWEGRKEQTIPAIGKSPREMMQTLGTEWGRQTISPDLWIVMAQQELRNRGQGMVITDLRFENEAAWVRKNRGVVIHITRKSAPAVNPHASETALIVQPGDIQMYNDSTLEALQGAVSKLFGGDV